MCDDARMTIAARGHQHPVRHFPAIIQDRISREVAHPTIRFLHDQIGGGKIPIMTVAPRKSRIERAMRDAAEPERKRADTRMQLDVAR